MSHVPLSGLRFSSISIQFPHTINFLTTKPEKLSKLHRFILIFNFNYYQPLSIAIVYRRIINELLFSWEIANSPTQFIVPKNLLWEVNEKDIVPLSVAILGEFGLD